MEFNLHKKNKPGFSIIEIMIVLMIVGLMIAGALGGYRLYESQKASSTASTINTLDARVSQYYDAIGEYPEDMEELAKGPKDSSKSNEWQHPALEAKDLKNAWGKPIEYSKTADGYILKTYNQYAKKTLYSRGSEKEG